MVIWSWSSTGMANCGPNKLVRMDSTMQVRSMFTFMIITDVNCHCTEMMEDLKHLRSVSGFFFSDMTKLLILMRAHTSPSTITNREVFLCTVIAEIFVRVKILYSSACRLSYARNFRTATVMSDTLVYVYGFRMLLNFVLSAKSTKYTKLNRVWKFVRLQ